MSMLILKYINYLKLTVKTRRNLSVMRRIAYKL